MAKFPSSILVGVFAIILTFHYTQSISVNEFLVQRERLLAEESQRILGGSLTLNNEEQLVNNLLMESKIREYDQSFTDLNFAPAYNFFQSKPTMLQSEVYQFIRQMPKGKYMS